MNTYRIILNMYKPNGDFVQRTTHFVDHKDPTQAQIDFLKEHVDWEGDITEHPVIGSVQVEVTSRHGYIFRTSDIMLVKLVDSCY